MAKITMNIKNQKIQISFVALNLCIAILALDYVGVKVDDQNGLAFNVHCYLYGTTFIAASAIFTWMYWLSSEKTKLMQQVVRGTVLGAVWWVLSFVALLYFHGAVGGRM